MPAAAVACVACQEGCPWLPVCLWGNVGKEGLDRLVDCAGEPLNQLNGVLGEGCPKTAL